MKTNAMRILDRLHCSYRSLEYGDGKAMDAVSVAEMLGVNPKNVFKTLVTQSPNKQYFVFMIPAQSELDLKKAAHLTVQKSIYLLKSAELLPLTGYVHGGCSPLGMKKQFKTYIHYTAEKCDKIYFSGGKIGVQIETTLSELKRAIDVIAADCAADQQ